jgi:N-acetylneuraminic acid mutarotase
MIRRLLTLALLSGASFAPALQASARDLALAERIALETEIERVRYSHQIGTHVPFEVAVPRAVVERRVRRTLQQSAALEAIWHTPLTAAMLEAETERMAARSRMPDRLRELFGALGNDAVAVQECLARPLVADRLIRSFYASDAALHAGARAEAETLADALRRYGAAAFASDPRRTEVTLREREIGAGDLARERGRAPAAAGVVGPVDEESDAFVLRVVLDEGPGFARIATFSVPKRSFDDWWSEAAAGFDPLAVRTVADPGVSLPAVAAGAEACPPDDSWVPGTLTGPADPRSLPGSVWTGTHMIVWGGVQGTTRLATGARYDPATDTWAPTSTTSAPSARSDHTAVWSGSRMVVWGGYVGGITYLATGARYDPVADAWTATSTVGAPSARANHSAVWTGSQMIVWGGADSSSSFQNGSRYDPVADTWTSVSTTAAPSGRAYHTAVWSGSRMVVWGGDDNDLTPIHTGGRYDPVANTWASTSTTAAPTARDGHSAIWTGTRMVVWGGADANAITQNTGAQYDPVGNTWTAIDSASAPAARSGHMAVWTGSRMIVWGGASTSDLDSGSSYDPAANVWTPISSAGAPRGRKRGAAVWTGTRMIVWGGDRGGEGMATGGRYDPTTDTWTPTSMLGAPSERSEPRGVWTGNHLVVWGGYSGLTNGYLQTGGRYDPATDHWSPTSLDGAPTARRYHSAVWTGSSMIVWGGWNGITFFDTGGRYDPISDTWIPTSTVGAPTGRLNHSAVWTGSLMVVWGAGVNTGGRYDPASDTWTPTSVVNAPAARTEHRAVWTGSRMVVWGGFSGATYFTAGGRYDPATDSWTATSTAGVPAGRRYHSAVWTGSRVVVWGGIDSGGTPFADGGRYDPVGDTWTPTSPTGALGARFDHSAVWTGRSVVVWGGYTGLFNGYLADGARYDPVADSWTPTSSAGAPTARRLHLGVWTGSEMIVWGGSAVSGTLGTGGGYALHQTTDDDGDGVSECGGDCNDGNASVKPGAAEVCDGLDNDCDGVRDDGIAPPEGSPSLGVSKNGTDAILAWAPTSGATSYDTVEGGVLSLRDSGGSFTSSVLACLANGSPGTSVVASSVPGAGDGLWFLVRGGSCVGPGTYDEGSASQQGSRDAEIAASANACP